MQRSLKRVLVTAATIALLGATSATPAGAVPAEPAAPSDVSIQTHCVSYDVHRHWYANHVHLSNLCSAQRRVKVVLSRWFDSPCLVLNGFTSRTYNHLGGFFDELVHC